MLKRQSGIFYMKILMPTVEGRLLNLQQMNLTPTHSISFLTPMEP